MEGSREIDRGRGKSGTIGSETPYLPLRFVRSEGKRKSRRGREL